MKQVITFQLSRLFRYKPFLWSIIAYFAVTFLVVHSLYLSLNYFRLDINIKQGIFDHNSIWFNICWLIKYANLLISFLFIGIIANDFRYGMIKQNIINGFTKKQVIATYTLSSIVFALFSLVLISSISLIYGVESSKTFQWSDIAKGLFGFFFYTIIVLQFCMLLTLILRKSVPTIMSLVIIYLIGEPLLGFVFDYYTNTDYSKFLPFSLIAQLLPQPILMQTIKTISLESHIIWIGSCSYFLLYTIGSYVYLKFKDL